MNDEIEYAEDDSNKDTTEMVSDVNADKDDLDEIFENIPKEKRHSIREHMQVAAIQMGGMFSPANDVSKKITEEHIKQYLEGSKSEMEHSYAEKKQQKIFILLTMFLTMVFLVVVIVLLKDIPNIMEKIIYTIGGIVAGAFGGYGIGKHRNDE